MEDDTCLALSASKKQRFTEDGDRDSDETETVTEAELRGQFGVWKHTD